MTTSRLAVIASFLFAAACAQSSGPAYTPVGTGSDAGTVADAGPTTGGVCPAAANECAFGTSCGNSPCTCYPAADGGPEPRCCVLGGHAGCMQDSDCCNTLGCDAGTCECLPTGDHCHFNNGCCSGVCNGGGSYTAEGVCQ